MQENSKGVTMTSINSWLIGLLVLISSNVGSYFYGMHVEEQIQIGKQAKPVIESLNNTVATVTKHSETIVADVKNDNEIERKANEKYETASKELRKARDDNRTLIRELGGLRISTSVCTIDSTINGKTETAGTSQRDDPFAGTIALPQQIEQDLQDSTDEADDYIERFRILQDWVKEQGFYGPVPKPVN